MPQYPDKSRINYETNVFCLFLWLLYFIDLMKVQFLVVQYYYTVWEQLPLSCLALLLLCWMHQLMRGGSLTGQQWIPLSHARALQDLHTELPPTNQRCKLLSCSSVTQNSGWACFLYFCTVHRTTCADILYHDLLYSLLTLHSLLS